MIGVIIIVREDPHAPITQGMEQIQNADESISDTEMYQRFLFHVVPGIPGQREQGKGNDDAERFGQGMKEQIVSETYIIESGE